MAGIKLKAKVWLRSHSLKFTRDYFEKDSRPASESRPARRVYEWNGLPIHYRAGTSDARLIYNILLKRGRKSEYAVPSECKLDPRAVRTVLDIGANIGISAAYLASVFPNAEVHAFEPEPGNCELLRANAQACPRIKAHPFALGAADGELTLFDSDDDANFGGFSAHRLGVNPGRSKSVPVRHAGRAIKELGIGPIDVAKIDTEGAEWDILTAMHPEQLRGVRLIMGELHGIRDFELLAFLQPTFDIGMRKQIRNRLFNFYAVNRNP
jgi:FkbM family methyltransferase